VTAAPTDRERATSRPPAIREEPNGYVDIPEPLLIPPWPFRGLGRTFRRDLGSRLSPTVLVGLSSGTIRVKVIGSSALFASIRSPSCRRGLRIVGDQFKTHEAFVNWLGSSYPEDISNTAKGASFRDFCCPPAT
jgi:hypothetical protein